jgi:hypothetical protein
MPGVVETTHTFATNEVITSTLMNNIIDETLFTSDAIASGNTTLALTAGKMKVGTITSNEMGAGSVTTNAIASSSSAATGVTYAKLQYVANMKAIGNTSGSLGVASEVSILDEDNMVSDSATSLATQQSIKAYTDTKVAAVITRGTAVATTSGTSVDFTSIPSTVKRITVMLSGVSTNGTSPIILQLGDAGGVETTADYLGSAGELRSTPDVDLFTTGFGLSQSPSASDLLYGIATIVNISGNVWIYSFIGGSSTVVNNYIGGGSKTLTATLDRIRLTTSGGVNTFDAGSVNIMYE